MTPVPGGHLLKRPGGNSWGIKKRTIAKNVDTVASTTNSLTFITWTAISTIVDPLILKRFALAASALYKKKELHGDKAIF